MFLGRRFKFSKTPYQTFTNLKTQLSPKQSNEKQFLALASEN